MDSSTINCKTVLVTGGCGFIGTHLVKKLAEKGLSVRVLDLNKPKEPAFGVEYWQGDILDEASLKVNLEGVDAVIHLAAKVSVPQCEQDPIASYEGNVLGVLKILELLKKQKQTRLIFTSSSSVYGNPQTIPIKEIEASLTLQSLYACQKLQAEQLIQYYAKQYGILALIYRLFNVYGLGQDPISPYSGVMTLFLESIKNNKPLLLFGGGHQTRDFISVEDVSELLGKTVSWNTGVFNSESYNVGTSYALSIRSLAEMMIGFSGKDSMLLEAPARVGDVLHSCADITKISSTLNWHPEISVEQGLKNLIDLCQTK